jgi:catechol 2,3-dioxygenase-like lactoylglutathione lyase family enzyme
LISGLHHYALRVPDLAVADSFLQDFGLETADASGSLVARCPGRGQDQVRLIEGGGAAKQLHYVSFTVHPGTLDAVRESLHRDGALFIDPPAGAPEDGLWTCDPDGTAVQLVDVEPAKPRPIADVLVNIGASASAILCSSPRNRPG